MCPKETARTIDLPLNRRQNGELSALLIGAQIATERTLVKLCEILICDRGIPDIWSHNLAVKGRGAEITSHEIEELSRGWSKSYDLVIQSVSDDNVPIPPDGVRVVDKSYRKKLEAFHREAMKLLEVTPDFCFDSSASSVNLTVSETLCYLRARIASKAS